VRQAAQTIDVTDPKYGAVGDGVTNDRAAFQAAIDSAIAARLPLWVPRPAVHYQIDLDPGHDKLEVGGDLTILGAGRDQCLIRFNVVGADASKNYAGLFVRNGNAFRISDLRLDETLHPREFELQGIFFETGAEDHVTHVERVDFDGFTNCIYSPSSGSGDSKGELFLTVRDCDIRPDRFYCVAFWAVEEGHKRLHLYDCYFHDNSESHLVYCHPHISVHCENCRFDGAEAWAFHFQGSAVAGDPEYQRFIGCWFGPRNGRGIITQDRVDTYTLVEVRHCLFECRPAIQIRSDMLITNCYFTTPEDPPSGSTFISAYSNAPWKVEIAHCVFAPRADSLPMIDLRLENIEARIHDCQFYNQKAATIIAVGISPTNLHEVRDCFFYTRTTNDAQTIAFSVENGQTTVDNCRFIGRVIGGRGVFMCLSSETGPGPEARLQVDNCHFEALSGGSLFYAESGFGNTWSQRISGANNRIEAYASEQPLLITGGDAAEGAQPMVAALTPTPGAPDTPIPAGDMLIISSNYDTYTVNGTADVRAIHWWTADGASDSLFTGTISLTAATGLALVAGGNLGLASPRREVGPGETIRLSYDPAAALWTEVTG
jgi:hypothetical protein